MKFYKFLDKDNCAEYSGFDYTPYLPEDHKPGRWLPELEDVVMCDNGYHSTDVDHLVVWANAQLFEVEYSDIPITDDCEKYVGGQYRLVRKIKGYDQDLRMKFALHFIDMMIQANKEWTKGEDLDIPIKARAAITAGDKSNNNELIQELYGIIRSYTPIPLRVLVYMLIETLQAPGDIVFQVGHYLFWFYHQYHDSIKKRPEYHNGELDANGLSAILVEMIGEEL